MWVTREVDVPADAAWDLLIDIRRWPEWGPSVRQAMLDTDGRGEDGHMSHQISAGSTGRVRTALGPWIAFQVTTFDDDDDDGRSWSWRVAGVPATVHRVEPLGGRRCRVGFEVPAWAAPYAVVCAVALRRIDHALTD